MTLRGCVMRNRKMKRRPARRDRFMDNPKMATQLLAKTYADRGDPNGWFEEFYARADGDIHY